MPEAAKTMPIMPPVDSGAGAEEDRLLRYRLDRVRAELAARDIAVGILFDPINIR